MRQKGFGAIILIFILLFLLVLSYIFLTRPYRVYTDNVTPPFKPKQLLLAEKITYLFKKPQTGDRVIFIPQKTDSTYVGLITQTENEGDVTAYTIVSVSDSKRPWKVSADKITGKIYYPFLDPAETSKIALSLQSTPTPPSPSTPEPTASESSPSGDIANWKTFNDPYEKLSIKYPASWATNSNRHGGPPCVQPSPVDFDGQLCFEATNRTEEFSNISEAQKYMEDVFDLSNLSKVEFLEKEKRTLGELTVWYFQLDETSRTETTYVLIESPSKSKIARITIADKARRYKATHDQILSTFKFIP